jgi:hypothetical protein
MRAQGQHLLMVSDPLEMQPAGGVAAVAQWTARVVPALFMHK